MEMMNKILIIIESPKVKKNHNMTKMKIKMILMNIRNNFQKKVEIILIKNNPIIRNLKQIRFIEIRKLKMRMSKTMKTKYKMTNVKSVKLE